jgi:hypothetical protein
LATGIGGCARAGSTSLNEYYCNTFPNCNNWGPTTGSPAGVGWTCWDPSKTRSVACTSSQWQCATSATGVGTCARLADSFSYTCATKFNCNVIGSCYDSYARSTVTCPAPFATKGCQTNTFGIFKKSKSAGCSTTCSSSNYLLLHTGTSECCHFNNCNRFSLLSSSLHSHGQQIMRAASSLSITMALTIYLVTVTFASIF